MEAGISDTTKIALQHAEASSQRCRWITFLLQIAAVLVIVATWEQSDLHWSTLRLTAAQNAVWVLTCDPASVYGAIAAHPVAGPAGAAPLADQKPATPAESLENRDLRYRCSVPMSKSAKTHAVEYIKQWNYSLADARQNVADLQQHMSSKIIQVSIPILGLVVDINDLSVTAGLAFSVLLSWFHFSLRRQDENIRQLFDRARRNGELADAYDLLAMTQVLTLPPTVLSRIRPPSIVQRLRRLPNLIMCTAAVADGIVIANDFTSMKHGNTLSPVISWTETIIAVGLFVYIVVRTCHCFQLMGQTYKEWGQAYKDITAGEPKPLIRVQVEPSLESPPIRG